MKLAILGVGSFVFGPSALHDAIVEHKFDGAHLALFDPNTAGMELMAQVALQMAKAAGISIRITTHMQVREALEGASFVVSSAAVQIQKRFAMDCQIVQEMYPDHLITEFGGVAGISYTLRQVELVRDLAAQMRQVCPKAWLLTASNPLPRICESLTRMGIQAAGLCSNSSQVYGAIGQVLLGAEEPFPWTRTRSLYQADMAGVNHFTWLLALRDRTTGADVTEEFMRRLQESPIGQSRPMSMDLMRRCGKYPPNGDTHMADFVKPTGQVPSLGSSSHGTPEERAARMKLLEDVAAGRAHYGLLMDHRAWERPMGFVAGVACGKKVEFASLNLPNAGQLPQMPAGAYVETRVEIRGGQITPVHHVLPPEAAKLNHAAAVLHSTLVDACMNHDRKRLGDAVELDPTIQDKKRGMAAVEACMKAHADLIGW